MIELIIGIIIGTVGVIIGLWASIKFTLGTAYKCEANKKTKPISSLMLESKYKQLNKKNPFKFINSKEKNINLIVEWNVLDTKWIETLGKSWLSIKYVGFIVLDEKTKTVRYHEKIVEKNMSFGSFGFYGNSFFQKGMIISRRIKSYRFGIKEDGSIGEIYNFDFNPLDLKGLVRQIANDNGWNFIIYFSKWRMKK